MGTLARVPQVASASFDSAHDETAYTFPGAPCAPVLANQATAGNGAMTLTFHIGRLWRGVPESRRWAEGNRRGRGLDKRMGDKRMPDLQDGMQF